MAKFSSPLTEIPVGKTEISVTEPARPLIWTHRKFYKGFRGKARSRKPGHPGQPGTYEQALVAFFCFSENISEEELKALIQKAIPGKTKLGRRYGLKNLKGKKKKFEVSIWQNSRWCIISIDCLNKFNNCLSNKVLLLFCFFFRDFYQTIDDKNFELVF